MATKKMTKTKKKNLQDATLRNLRVSRQAERRLTTDLKAALGRISALEHRLEQVEIRQRDVPCDSPVE